MQNRINSGRSMSLRLRNNIRRAGHGYGHLGRLPGESARQVRGAERGAGIPASDELGAVQGTSPSKGRAVHLTSDVLSQDGLLLLGAEPDDDIALNALRMAVPLPAAGSAAARITAVGYVDEEASDPKNLADDFIDRDDLVGVPNRAVRALAAMGRGTVPALVEALRKQDPLVRWVATWALSALGRGAEPAIPALKAVVLDHRLDPRQGLTNGTDAATVIARLGPAGLPALSELSHNRRSQVRVESSWRWKPILVQLRTSFRYSSTGSATQSSESDSMRCSPSGRSHIRPSHPRGIAAGCGHRRRLPDARSGGQGSQPAPEIRPERHSESDHRPARPRHVTETFNLASGEIPSEERLGTRPVAVELDDDSSEQVRTAAYGSLAGWTAKRRRNLLVPGLSHQAAC